MAEYRFSAGEKVVINSSEGALHSFTDNYGFGPFEVATVRDVPMKCDCGFPSPLHHPTCQINLRQLVGHSQWVILKLPDKISQEFSGSLLIPYSPAP